MLAGQDEGILVSLKRVSVSIGVTVSVRILIYTKHGIINELKNYHAHLCTKKLPN
jgi:hypothetical protein